MSLAGSRNTRCEILRRIALSAWVAAGSRRALACSDDLAPPDVLEALRFARRSGRPLLVSLGTGGFLQPNHLMFSTFLTGATADRLAMLALIDAVCCDYPTLGLAMLQDGFAMSEVPQRTAMLALFVPSPDGRSFEIHPFEWLKWWRVRNDEVPLPKQFDSEVDRWNARESRADRFIQENDDKIAAFLERALGQDPNPRDERAECRSQYLVELARSRMSRREIEIATSRTRDFGRLKPPYLKRWSPLLLERARVCAPEQRNEIIQALAGVVRREWVIDAPPGAIWELATPGCSGLAFEQFTFIDPEEHPSLGCGIAYIPDRESRFLHSLTNESFEMIRPRVPGDRGG